MASEQSKHLVELFASIRAGEAVGFAKQAKDAGIDVSVHSLPEGQHNFILGAGHVPEVDQAIEEIAGWLRSRLGLTTLTAK
jgi:epsilon-lactone hydrolase